MECLKMVQIETTDIATESKKREVIGCVEGDCLVFQLLARKHALQAVSSMEVLRESQPCVEGLRDISEILSDPPIGQFGLHIESNR